jgi:hypothetical protein
MKFSILKLGGGKVRERVRAKRVRVRVREKKKKKRIRHYIIYLFNHKK